MAMASSMHPNVSATTYPCMTSPRSSIEACVTRIDPPPDDIPITARSEASAMPTDVPRGPNRMAIHTAAGST